jgi:hypothetical protein
MQRETSYIFLGVSIELKLSALQRISFPLECISLRRGETYASDISS